MERKKVIGPQNAWYLACNVLIVATQLHTLFRPESSQCQALFIYLARQKYDDCRGTVVTCSLLFKMKWSNQANNARLRSLLISLVELGNSIPQKLWILTPLTDIGSTDKKKFTVPILLVYPKNTGVALQLLLVNENIFTELIWQFKVKWF